ncbi:uncharacterized protein LOC119681098 isoform X1 [Teleopsis dalmanni]|uniref:uncharacterized protein LOC119681098 isoform X1 n=1 Tax=Teleopsis dalmanni TaxID=139649 RepID=UPI0018CD1441|nr:uncharacterized protein LOC119681098 isoform X1 [Teleopsis dalmanni]
MSSDKEDSVSSFQFKTRKIRQSLMPSVYKPIFMPGVLKMRQTPNQFMHTSLLNDEDTLLSIRDLFLQEKSDDEITEQDVNESLYEKKTYVLSQSDDSIICGIQNAYTSGEEKEQLKNLVNIKDDSMLHLRKSFYPNTLSDDEIMHNLKQLYDEDIEKPCCSRYAKNENSKIEVEFYNTKPIQQVRSVIDFVLNKEYPEFSEEPTCSRYLANKSAQFTENSTTSLKTTTTPARKITFKSTSYENCEKDDKDDKDEPINSLKNENVQFPSIPNESETDTDSFRFQSQAFVNSNPGLDESINTAENFSNILRKYKLDLMRLTTIREQKRVELLNAKLDRQKRIKVYEELKFKKQIELINIKMSLAAKDGAESSCGSLD